MIACNVPLNNRLAAADVSAAGARTVWSNYTSAWLRWNHVRTVMSAIAALSFMFAATWLGGATS